MTIFSRLILYCAFLTPAFIIEASQQKTSCKSTCSSFLASICFWKSHKIQDIEQMGAEVEKKVVESVLGTTPLQRSRTISSILADCTNLPYDLIKIIASYDQLIFNQGSPIYSLAVLPHETFAAGDKSGTIKFWNAQQTERYPQILTGHQGPVSALGVSPKQELVSLSTLHERCIRAFSIIGFTEQQKTFLAKKTLPTDYFVVANSITSDGSAPSESRDETLKLWNPVTGELLSSIAPDASLAIQEPISSTSPQRLSGTGRAWNITQKEHQKDMPIDIEFFTARPLKSKVSRTHTVGDKYLIGCTNGTITIQAIHDHRIYGELHGHTGAIRGFVTISDALVASASDDGTIKIWYLPKQLCIKTIYAHTGPVRALELLPDQRLLSGSEDGTARIHNICINVQNFISQLKVEKPTEYDVFSEMHIGR